MNHSGIHRLAITIGSSFRARFLWAGCMVLSALAGCAYQTRPTAVVFRGAAPCRGAVIMSLRRFQTHFNRSIFATLRVHGRRINLVGRWSTIPPSHFKFVALTEMGTLAVELQRFNSRIIINHLAAQFPGTLARELGNDLYLALAAPARAARSSPVISLGRHHVQLPVSAPGLWHGTLYFSGAAGHLALTQLNAQRRRITIRYSRYRKGFQPGRLTILDSGQGFKLTLDFTGNVP